MQKIRCAIYTRKSSEDGLEQEFNSLHAQREACAAYVTSQKAEGWVLNPDYYDDGGISGGTLNRPGLQQLLKDIDDRKVDRIVVYKIDRLTRSLADFAKIVDRLDAAEASFVSVTQSFNTATSMGRLTLNMLLSFAQFEREVTAERIRDKLAASKRKGLWMGGYVPMGYQPDGRTLVIDTAEAEVIRTLYDLYEHHLSIIAVRDAAAKQGLRSRLRPRLDGTTTGGKLFDRGQIHHILANPIYAGRIRHKDKVFEGQHPAIIEPDRWERIQKLLSSAAGRIRGKKNAAHSSPLAGKIFDETGDRLTPSHSKKGGKRLRYYISRRLVEDRSKKHPDAWRLPARPLEAAVASGTRTGLSGPNVIIRFVRQPEAGEIDGLAQGINRLTKEVSDLLVLELVARIHIQPGRMQISLDQQKLADCLGVDNDRIVEDELRIEVAFRIRRKGVENRIVVGEAAPEIDRTLVSNIVKARKWYADIGKGMTFIEIAEREGSSKRRIQDIVDLAFLSPDLLQQIVAGTQPDALTTDALIKNGFPALWPEQRALFARHH